MDGGSAVRCGGMPQMLVRPWGVQLYASRACGRQGQRPAGPGAGQCSRPAGMHTRGRAMQYGIHLARLCNSNSLGHLDTVPPISNLQLTTQQPPMPTPQPPTPQQHRLRCTPPTSQATHLANAPAPPAVAPCPPRHLAARYTQQTGGAGLGRITHAVVHVLELGLGLDQRLDGVRVVVPVW